MESQRRILLAEDDDELRDLIQQSLEESQYRVIALEDGFELIDYLVLVRESPHVPRPDLILSDVNMPGRTALDVLEQMRASELGCPIVLISAFADDEMRQRAVGLGATILLDKPVDPTVLVPVVRALVPPSPSEHVRGRKLLVAEDDDEMRAWLTVALGSERDEVREASTGWELLSALAEPRPFDLVITDVRMPGPTGIQVLGMARNAGVVTPFLLITAFSDHQLRASMAELADVALLDKPFEQSEFLNAVERMLHPAVTPTGEVRR
jgi:CheY-like chemotaxis protein